MNVSVWDSKITGQINAFNATLVALNHLNEDKQNLKE